MWGGHAECARLTACGRVQDDFYLNLVDWSSLNVLAVGLGSCVYLWSACTSKVTKLCDLGRDDSLVGEADPAAAPFLRVGVFLRHYLSLVPILLLDCPLAPEGLSSMDEFHPLCPPHYCL